MGPANIGYRLNSKGLVVGVVPDHTHPDSEHYVPVEQVSSDGHEYIRCDGKYTPAQLSDKFCNGSAAVYMDWGLFMGKSVWYPYNPAFIRDHPQLFADRSPDC